MKRGKRKRVMLAADTHCGHLAGLTPPEFWVDSDIFSDKIKTTQKLLWEFYSRNVGRLKPIDIAIFNGDLIDGRGEKSGGTELITGDRRRQTQIAIRCIEETDASRIYIARGTDYHVGPHEEWEDVIASRLDAIIADHLFIQINGRLFDVKHHLGNHSLPHTSLTPIAKEILWNKYISATSGEQPTADVIVRAHVHKDEFMLHDGCYGVSLPGLQGFGSRFGKKRISRSIDFGFRIVDVYEDGKLDWHDPIILEGTHQPVTIHSAC